MLFAIQELELIKSHVRESEALVARQREIIAQLKARNLPAQAAEKLLSSFEACLARDRTRLDEALIRSEAARATDVVAHGIG